MNHRRYFREIFESIQDYGKIVLVMFLTENDNDLSTECGFLKNDFNRLCLKSLYLKTY